MTTRPDDCATRLARWWVRRYTAGLPDYVRRSRRDEIDSDLVEHARCRAAEDWTSNQIVRERLGRQVRGVFADLSWRHEILTREYQARGFVRLAVMSVTSIAALTLAVFHFAFAAYLLGDTSLAERRFLGGIDGYAEEVGRPVASVMAALIIAALGLALLAAALARPVSPLVANAVTMAIAMVAVMFFWLGVWPVGIVAVFGSCIDLAIRTPSLAPRS